MDEERLKNRIRVLLDEIQTEVDPELLNRYRALFRREVSFFQRSYMAAYLLLLAEEGSPAQGKAPFARPSRKEAPKGKPAKDGKKGRKEFRRDGEAEGEAEKKEFRNELPEDESVRLFVSVGRNRKIFPREILGLINAKTEVAREDIGNIRILDNYSFVQVRTEVAEKVIEALNGQPFRGRTLTVNYARAKKEELPKEAPPAEPQAELSPEELADEEAEKKARLALESASGL
jgi:hypothetical protein